MPRLSADSLSVVPVARLDLPPPAHLGDAETLVWRDVLASADNGHFRHEDRELLALYCMHVVEVRRLAKLKRRNAEQKRDLRAETALVASLSTKLRLGPKSRSPNNRRGVGKPVGPPSYYELMRREEPQAGPPVETARRWS